MYKRINHLLYTSIYQPLSYPFRSLYFTNPCQHYRCWTHFWSISDSIWSLQTFSCKKFTLWALFLTGMFTGNNRHKISRRSNWYNFSSKLKRDFFVDKYVCLLFVMYEIWATLFAMKFFDDIILENVMNFVNITMQLNDVPCQ